MKLNTVLSALVLSLSMTCNIVMADTPTNSTSTSSNTQQTTVFQPTRSVLMVSVRSDADLPAAYRWLYKDHVPDSISQFKPYVTQYATYRALPLPKDAENFGTYNWIMTEHYWLINPFNHSGDNAPRGLAYSETFTKEYMEITNQPTDAGLRPNGWQGSIKGYHPTAFAFMPIFWEWDLKGSDRTIEDGPVARWLTMLNYPDGVSQEEGDKWYKEQFLAELANLPEVKRILSSRVLDDPKTGPFQRVTEIWFNNTNDWQAAMEKVKAKIAKPKWAKWDQFPYIEPYKNMVGEFLLERPESDHLEQYRGYNYTR